MPSDSDRTTTLYLIRHGATEANLATPARLQGRRNNPPLARLGVRQAEVTRDYLAVRAIDHCYCSPLLRAVQTATIVAKPHGVTPVSLPDLTECDVGRWEGLDWQTIRYLDAEGYQRFHNDPAAFGYRGGRPVLAATDKPGRRGLQEACNGWRPRPAAGLIRAMRSLAVRVLADFAVDGVEHQGLGGLLDLEPARAFRAQPGAEPARTRLRPPAAGDRKDLSVRGDRRGSPLSRI